MQGSFIPPEVIGQIAKHLTSSDISKATRVCQTWRTAFLQWTYRDTLYARRDAQDLLTHGHHVHHLRTFTVSEEDLDLISTACPNLKSLQMEIEHISPKAMQLFWQRLAIEQLDLSLQGTRLSQLVLAPLTFNHSRLTSLSLSGLYKCTTTYYQFRDPNFHQNARSPWHSNLLLHILKACSSTLVHLQLRRMCIGEYPIEVSRKDPRPLPNARSQTTTPSPRGSLVPATQSCPYPMVHSNTARWLPEPKQSWWSRLKGGRHGEYKNSGENRWSVLADAQKSTAQTHWGARSTNGLSLCELVSSDSPEEDMTNTIAEVQRVTSPCLPDTHVVWEKLRTVHLEDVVETWQGRSLLLSPLLQHSPNVQHLWIKSSMFSMDRLQNHCQRLESLRLDGGACQLLPRQTVAPFLATASFPALRSLTILGSQTVPINPQSPPRWMEQLDELTWWCTSRHLQQELERLLVATCPRLCKLVLAGLPWQSCYSMQPQRWQCHAVLQTLEGVVALGTMSLYWASMQDSYGAMTMLRQIRISQHQFRFFYAWLYRINANVIALDLDTTNDSNDSTDDGQAILEKQADKSSSSLSSATVAVQQKDGDRDKASVCRLPQIQVLEVVGEKPQHAIRVKELRGVLEVMESLKVLLYVGRSNPFTNAAWEWVQRAYPDLKTEHRAE